VFAKREVRCTNADCGALNRVPGYAIRLLPQCGKCHTKLPEVDAIKFLRQVYRFRIALVGVPLLAIISGYFWSSAPTGTAKQSAQSKQAALLCSPRTLPPTGLYEDYSLSEPIAQLTIRTTAGSNYFVNLEDAATEIPAMLFFIYGGNTLEARVPLGSFKLKYATGKLWCGDFDIFGPETVFSKAHDVFAFTRSVEDTSDGCATTTSHWVVELIPQRGGNLRTEGINRAEFFGRAARRH
jgi:hypothetical protein